MQIWKKELPDVVQSGRVKFQGDDLCSILYIQYMLTARTPTVYDFFTTQPVKNASIFLLKQVLHDWSDLYAAKILTQLRAAAAPTTKLIIVESIVAYACHDPNSESIPGAAPREAPSPLLPNYGPINDMQYNGDLTVCRNYQTLTLEVTQSSHRGRCFSQRTPRSVRPGIS